MTDQEAQDKAVAIWGPRAVIWRIYYTEGDGFLKNVGVLYPEDRRPPNVDRLLFGHGTTWEAAFEDAKAKGH